VPSAPKLTLSALLQTAIAAWRATLIVLTMRADFSTG
jgi:hypothetical protein